MELIASYSSENCYEVLDFVIINLNSNASSSCTAFVRYLVWWRNFAFVSHATGYKSLCHTNTQKYRHTRSTAVSNNVWRNKSRALRKHPKCFEGREKNAQICANVEWVVEKFNGNVSAFSEQFQVFSTNFRICNPILLAIYPEIYALAIENALHAHSSQHTEHIITHTLAENNFTVCMVWNVERSDWLVTHNTSTHKKEKIPTSTKWFLVFEEPTTQIIYNCIS